MFIRLATVTRLLMPLAVIIQAGWALPVRAASTPLAPPSSINMSTEELFLHLRIYVITDVYAQILRPLTQNINEAKSPDDEILEDLIQDQLLHNRLIQTNANFDFFCLNQEFYITIDSHYVRCFMLEILPQKYDFQYEELTKDKYNSKKSLKMADNIRMKTYESENRPQ